jgi:hypothetical protein
MCFLFVFCSVFCCLLFVFCVLLCCVVALMQINQHSKYPTHLFYSCSFLECESGGESGRWAIYASMKDQRGEAHERWRYLDDMFIEHVRVSVNKCVNLNYCCKFSAFVQGFFLGLLILSIIYSPYSFRRIPILLSLVGEYGLDTNIH